MFSRYAVCIFSLGNTNLYIYIYIGIMAPAAAYAEIENNNLGTSDAKFIVSSNKGDAQIVIGQMENNVLRNSNGSAPASGIYLKGDTEGSILNITVEGGTQTAGAGGWPYRNQIQIMGNVQTLVSSGLLDDINVTADYRKLINAVPTDKYSTSSSGSTVNLTLKENAKFYGLIYGGRNDFSASNGADPNWGDSCGNTVNIKLEKGSVLGASLIFGARSGQGEGATADTNGNPYNVNLKKGYKTDNNAVIIRGEKLADNEINLANRNMYFPAGGIFGAEGWQANNNYVSLQYAYIQSAGAATRKFGIVGGRGLYNFRIYDGENSAIANNNIVVIKDSAIGTFGGPGMSVMGGYSYGQAKNNIVVMENTKINGHVYGGLELFGMTEASPDQRRQLHSNLVSLHNVELMGNSSIYGTATADSKTWRQAVNDGDRPNTEKQSYFGWDSVDEQSIKAVNRRRGIAHIGGQVKAGSAYVRYIHFGSYIDANTLQAHQTYDVFSPYYPNGSSSGAGAAVPVTFTQGKESTNLNQLVAGSYLWNTNGFHSALDAKDPNQSTSTNGQHNFWVNVYTNLSSVVNGDGTKFNTGASLFDASGNDVNHFYNGSANDYGYNANSEDDLSLLAMDDGMILSGSTGNGIMHDFREHYQGRVLYLGVNNGKDYAGNTINAVDIHFGDIEDFRQHNGQNANAFGNTQVGIFVDGKGSTGQYDQDPYHRDPVGDSVDSPRSWKDMVITIPNFKIVQNNSIVADATYGFYKYLHIDGDVAQDTNGRDVKQTRAGDAAGVGIKYWLKSLTIRPGALLTLKGNDGTVAKEDTYTLSAYLTGRGHVAIAENTEVIMGDTRVNDEAVDTDMLSGTGGFEQENTYENQYTGATIIRKGARLFQGSQGALGSAAHHTSNLVLENDGAGANGGQYFLQGLNQIVGGLLVSDTSAVDLSTQSKGTFDAANNKGYLDVQGYARVNDNGEVKGNANSTLAVTRGVGDIYSQNDDMLGTFALKSSSAGYLHNANSFTAALADIDATSELNFMSFNGSAANPGDATGDAYIGAIRNAGDVYLSNRSKGEDLTSLNTVNIARDYTGIDGSNIFYRGVIQGPTNSTVDAIHVVEATGTSLVAFGHFNNLTAGVFSSSRGERTDKSVGIPVFIIDDRDAAGSQLQLHMNNFGVVDKNDAGYEWVYSLGYNDTVNSATDREWVLYNSIDGRDNYQPRPEPGAYTSIAHSWSRMHMRLHDRFGQAYETDPFDAEHKPASAWIRQEGRLTKFHMSESGSRTRSFTSLTQVGGDLVRKEIDDVWKYNLGFFVGDLQNYSRSRTWNTAKGRAEGYGLGVYGTLYTGNSPDDGFYIDTWLTYNHFENKIYGNRPEFKYNSHGWVYSIETGLTLPLGETGDKPEDKYIWTLQPEFQVIWDGVDSGTARDTTGTTYSLLGNDNVVLRAGARLHANNMNKGLGYIEANWIHNTHKLGVMQGDHPFYMEGGQDLGELRFGLEGRASTNTLCWMTLGTQRGRHAYHNEIVQFGLRYMFK